MVIDMKVRLATSEDLPELIELQTRALQGLSGAHYTAEEIAAIVADQAEARTHGDETCYVAEEQGQIVGFAGILCERAKISAVYVEPDWARRGIGSKLLAAVEEEAKLRRIRTLCVMSSLMAVPFYKAQGFTALWATEFQTKSGVQIRCQDLKKNLVEESEPERVMRHGMLVGMGTLLLFLGFVFSRPLARPPQDSRIEQTQDFLSR